MNHGVVYLIGAGCGEADLITLRGKKILEICDCVVYDDLIDTAVLSFVPEFAEKIYVGKRKDKHSKNQSEINEILLHCSNKYHCVVRLKGGDPFIYGRGGEEILYLAEKGVKTLEIPGIASPIGIPSEYGIPITHRGVSDSVHILTGHSAEDDSLLDDKLAKLVDIKGTIIFLMSITKLENIVKKLLELGKSCNTSVAVMSGGNSQNKYCYRSTLGNILNDLGNVHLSSPGIIVVGDVAQFKLKVESNCSVGLIGTKAMNEKLSTLFSKHGINAVTIAEADIVRDKLDSVIETIISSAKPLIVFTSKNGVDVFFTSMADNKTDRRKLSLVKFAVIGNSTAERLSYYGYNADFVPSKATTSELANFLCKKVDRETTVFLYRSHEADNTLYSVLSRKFMVHDIRAYSCKYNFSHNVPQVDYLCFCSSSAVKEYSEHYSDRQNISKAVVIGEVTKNTFIELFGSNYLLAEEISAEGIVNTVIKNFFSRQK